MEKQLLFLSPCVPTAKLPQLLQRLTTMGVTVLDVQKLAFGQFHYMAGKVGALKREASFTKRGENCSSDVGFVIKLARENLHGHFQA